MTFKVEEEKKTTMAEFGALYIVSIKCSVLTQGFSAHRVFSDN